MKVVFLARRYLPDIGGVEVHIQKLVKALGPEYKVTVIAEQDNSELSLKDTIEGVNVLRIPLPNYQTNKWAIWFWWAKHLNLLFSADVIHIHDVFFWILPFRWLMFWKPVFMTFHGYEGTQNPTWKQIMWHQIAEVSTSGNLCIGGFHEKWYGVTPDEISFGAVEPMPEKKIEASFIFDKKVKKKICFVGRLAADTGILVYLEALRILQSKYSIELDIFGDGPEKKLAEEYVAKYDLHVSFHGFVDHEKIRWQKYDIAFVSRYLAILESFSAGVPVIAQYNVDIKRDYLELTPFKSWIITAHTTQQIVDGFETLLHIGNMEFTRSAKEWADEQTWQEMAEKYLTLWQKK